MIWTKLQGVTYIKTVVRGESLGVFPFPVEFCDHSPWVFTLKSKVKGISYYIMRSMMFIHLTHFSLRYYQRNKISQCMFACPFSNHDFDLALGWEYRKLLLVTVHTHRLHGP